ncbi:MAG: adenylate kinase [Candidatus Aenigmarchaeota archaeon]|nr:adenylate kinase [Candidatus Aenigmarchaeota archaeon]
MKFIFFGPPGCGKGTYASRIAPQLGIVHIATGDMFRAEVAAGTKLGKLAEKCMKAGNLVPDDVTIKMFKKRVKKKDAQKGFILDGFPRTLAQAKELDNMAKIDLVINIELSEGIILEKALARRICEKCGNIYNIADINRNGIKMPPLLPKKEGICDKCGGFLVQRKDDNEETIRDRLNIYRRQSEPLIEFYRKKKLVRDIKVVGPPEVMVPKIMEILKKR